MKSFKYSNENSLKAAGSKIWTVFESFLNCISTVISPYKSIMTVKYVFNKSILTIVNCKCKWLIIKNGMFFEMLKKCSLVYNSEKNNKNRI